MGRTVGRSVASPENIGLLRGATPFIADLDDAMLRGAAAVVFVRSPHAHARILGIDADAASRFPGVLAVVTAADHDLEPYETQPEYYGPSFATPVLADGVVRFAGEPVAAVAAETVAMAVDAAELVVVDYDPLEPVIDPNGSTIVALEHEADHDPAAFETADIVLTQRFVNPRQSPAPIEPYGQACAWVDGHLHVWAATQRPHGFRDQLAELYGLPAERIHVTAPAVGGGFGGKVSRTQEEHVLPLVARRVGRPVRWIQTRSEYFLGATQGRGEQMDFTIAADGDGRVRALRCDMVKDAGAYPGVGGSLPARFNAPSASGPYDIAHVEFAARTVVTNAPQISAFRGAGRGPYLAALERMLDILAADAGLDPVTVRERNLVRPEQMPFTAVTGAVYDEADYPGDLHRALALSGYEALRAEQAGRRASASVMQLGIGIATYHHRTVGGGSEEAVVRLGAGGHITVFTGTTSQGHGHAATWAQIVADELHVELERIEVCEGSTAFTRTGVGAVGSRSVQTAGVAVRNAAAELVDWGRRLAAARLEAAVADIALGDGGFHVVGVPSVSLRWEQLGEEHTCGDTHDVGDANSFPSGCHVAVAEVDIDTGHVTLRDYFGVDDAGIRINPAVVEGQLHGGIVAGVGQVLGETMSYDADGTPLTTSFADYPIPSIDVAPRFVLEASETPTSFNDLGVKGVGESGTIAAVPALHNAIVDAVSHLGVRHIELPCTPERVWRAIREVRLAP